MSITNDIRALIERINTERAYNRSILRTRNVNDAPFTYARKTKPVLYAFDKRANMNTNGIVVVRKITRAKMLRVLA